MKRRDFLVLAGTATVFPRIVLAQQAEVPRIVVLSNGVRDDARQALFAGLADFGYVDGKNISLEFLTAPTIADVPAYAAMAVARKPQLIWTLSSAPPLATKDLTTTIPVVFTFLQDPVAIGLVPNYTHPGGNLTGDMLSGIDYIGKGIALVREVLPSISRLAVLGLPADPPYPIMLSQTQAAAKSLNIEALNFETKEGDDLAPLFDRMTASGAQAIYVIVAQYLNANDGVIADFALRHKLPSFMWAGNVPNGIMVGYSSSAIDVIRRSASYIDAIFKGAKAGDLPVDQPKVFELVVNQKTATALGIMIPQTVLFQATGVIS